MFAVTHIHPLDMTHFERVEFKGRDGTVLRGEFFQTPGDSVPAIVIAAGFGLLKENNRRFAETCRNAGYSVLTFDYRGFGSSDGLPREEISFFDQGRDCQDAITALRALPGVDKNRVVMGGVGHGGTSAMVAASSDPRIVACILISPWPSSKYDVEQFPKRAVDAAWEELEKKHGTLSLAPQFIKPWRDWKNVEDKVDGSALIGGQVAYGLQATTEQLARAAGTPWRNRITLSSLLNIAGFEPLDYAKRIAIPTFYAIQIDGGLQQPHSVHHEAIKQFSIPPEVYKIPLPESEAGGEQNRMGFARAMEWLNRILEPPRA